MTTDERSLKEFMSAYFHQDWALDATSPDGVVAQYFRDHEGVSELLPVARALRSLIDSGDEDEGLSRRLVGEFGSYFDPRGTGESTRAWLKAMAENFELEINRRR